MRKRCADLNDRFWPEADIVPEKRRVPDKISEWNHWGDNCGDKKKFLALNETAFLVVAFDAICIFGNRR